MLKQNFSRLILFSLILFFGDMVYAQGYDMNQFVKMPSVAPPSPNVASIEKFGNIPVDLSTGVPEISIPVWNISCGDINWPVAISYHASGIRIDETASGTGLGWALIGPGVISRSVIGRPDEANTGEPNYLTVSSSNADYLYQVKDGLADSELDLFSYHFNGRSGKFLIKQDGTIFQMPFTNLKIINYSFNSFVILDENGAIYTFDKKEDIYAEANGSFTAYTGSWYLSKAETADKKQAITFQYISAGNTVQNFFNYSQSIGQRYTPGPNGCGTPVLTESFGVPSLSQNRVTTYVLQLSQINFPNGALVFTYTNDRKDILGSATGRLTAVALVQQPSNKVLRRFTFQHSYFFYRPPNIAVDNVDQYRLRLDVFRELAADNSITKPYTFEYNSTPMMPRSSTGQDKWGFNNGQYTNLGLIQRQTVYHTNGNTYQVGNAERGVDELKMQACQLTAITWPTGGKTAYFFEPHHFNTGFISTSPVSHQAYATGTDPEPKFNSFRFLAPVTGQTWARIKVNLSKFDYPGVTDRPYVKLTDQTSNAIVFIQANMTPGNELISDNGILLLAGHTYVASAFVYTTNSDSRLQATIKVEWQVNTGTPIVEKGGGLRIKEIKHYADVNLIASHEMYEYDPATTLTPFTYINKTFNEVSYRLGTNGCPGTTSGCIQTISPVCRVYHAGSVYPVTTVGGSPLMYNKVTKYNKDNLGVDNGKTEYNYDIIQDNEIPVGPPSLFSVHLMSNDWKNGFLRTQQIFKKAGTGYRLIQKKEHEYVEIMPSQTFSLKVYGNYVQSGCELRGPSNLYNDIGFFAFPIKTGSKKLSKIIETWYDDNDKQIVTQTENVYGNPNNDFLGQSSQTISNGSQKTVAYKHPGDFSLTGNVYHKMVIKNIISPVIEQKQFQGAVLLSTSKNNYRDWYNDTLVLATETIEASVNNNVPEVRLRYEGYLNNKNVSQVKKEKDLPNAYLWDYNYQYPIAEVKNGSQANIAYASFEGASKGNWTFAGVTVPHTAAPMGQGVYNLSGGSITKSISASSTYLVSYWRPIQELPLVIAGTQLGYPVSGSIVKGWKYYEHKVSGQSSVALSGIGYIDEVRLYPYTASMVTYNYDPLIGISSQCDINNRITYFIYDAIGRLVLTKDQDGNILKKVCYNYAGQPENCAL